MGRCVAYGKGSLPARMLGKNAQAECAPVYTQQGEWNKQQYRAAVERRRVSG